MMNSIYPGKIKLRSIKVSDYNSINIKALITLIFEPTLSGHHLEYLHHIHVGATCKDKDTFVFAVPRDEWGRMRDKCEWGNAENIQWLLLDDAECRHANSGSMTARCFKLSRFVRRVALQVRADRVLLISLADVIPFLPLMLPYHIKLSGIIYKIYLRAPKKGLRGLADKFRYTVMAHSRSMGKVFILNDTKSAGRLNAIYHTDKFVSLPDPVPDVDISTLCNLRQELEISPECRVFLHFGAMERRKGTLVILQSIMQMSNNELENKTFVFAGKVGREIKAEFYTLVSECRNRGAHVIVEDAFLPYDRLNNLCHTCDCILIPYLFTDLSSGALGYAAIHHKPVIGPADGLIGELIQDNGLGIGVSSVTPMSLMNAIKDKINFNCSNMYCEYNSKNNFVKYLLD